MKLIRHLKNKDLFSGGSAVTIGNFDGIHRGHVELLNKLIATAQQQNIPSVVVIFEPQPREVLYPSQAPARLTPLREKLHLLAQLPIDYVVCLRFDKALASLTATEFVEKILVRSLHAKYVLVGDDFCFGKQRQGNLTLLQELGKQFQFTTASMPTIEDNGTRVSSTLIRTALTQGDLKTAENALGRPYTVSGRVRRGAGRGKQWGFPTANLSVPPSGLPLSGVFVVRVHGLNLFQHPAVANIGTRPTVDGTRTVLEVLLLDFDGDLYGQHLEIEFLQKLRDEKKFDNMDLLLQQIGKDVETARTYFSQI
jgi:riboflavin kinase/FMN adenylyltransferase